MQTQWNTDQALIPSVRHGGRSDSDSSSCMSGQSDATRSAASTPEAHPYPLRPLSAIHPPPWQDVCSSDSEVELTTGDDHSDDPDWSDSTAPSLGQMISVPLRSPRAHYVANLTQRAQAAREEHKRSLLSSKQWHTRPGEGWLLVAQAMVQERKLADDRYRYDHRLVSRKSYSTDPLRGVFNNRGDQRLRNIQRDLDSMGVVRTSTQKLFHYWFTQAVAETIYGDEWDSSATNVLKKFGLKEPEYTVMVMTPRRFGKTWSIAMFVLAVIANVPGVRVAVFSTGKRASGSLMEVIMGFLPRIALAQRRVCKFTNEELYLAEHPLPIGRGMNSHQARVEQSRMTTAKLHCYPSSVKGGLDVLECVCARVRVAFLLPNVLVLL